MSKLERRTRGVRWIASGVLVAGVVAAMLPAHAGPPRDPYADAPPYLRSLTARARIVALLTVGQVLPRSGDSLATYRFVGVPDGMGIYAVDSLGTLMVDSSLVEADSTRPKKSKSAELLEKFRLHRPRPYPVLLVNHELDPGAGASVGPLPSGARISEIRFGWTRPRYMPKPLSPPRLIVRSGRCAIERVFAGDDRVAVDPVKQPFAKFCSAFLADARVGFDRPIFLCGEEALGDETFDGRGGQAYALDNGTLNAMPRFGRAEWENIVVARGTGARTVVFGLEDGPADGDGLHSQLYMYVGDKQPEAADGLAHNGLRNGAVYVLVGTDPAKNSEAMMTQKGDSTGVRWAALDWNTDDVGFDRAAKAAGAYGFVRIEDGACDPSHPGDLYFATTGAAKTVNPRGRVNRLRFDPQAPLDGGTLSILLDGSEGIVRPDNMDVNWHGELAIQEDPGNALHDFGLDRDSSIWMYEIATGKLARIAAIDRAAARRHALAANPKNRFPAKADVPGSWESSGIVDAERILGRGAWLCTVQAHGLQIDPVAETVEGGQVLEILYR